MNRKEARDIIDALTDTQREAVALFVQTAPVLWERDEGELTQDAEATLTRLANEIAGRVLPPSGDALRAVCAELIPMLVEHQKWYPADSDGKEHFVHALMQSYREILEKALAPEAGPVI